MRQLQTNPPGRGALVSAAIALWLLAGAGVRVAAEPDDPAPWEMSPPPPVVPTATSPETTISSADIESRIASIEAAKDLAEADRTKLLEFYRLALNELQASAAAERAREELAAFVELGPDRAQEVRAALDRIRGQRGSLRFLREPYTATELEQRLIKAQTELTARRSRVDALEQQASGLETRPGEAKAQLAAARAEIAEINDEARVAPPANELPEITEARQAALTARRMARGAQAAALEQELLSFDIRSQVIITERELAAARLAQSERHVETLEVALAERRRVDAEQVQREAEQRRAETVGSHPVVQGLAEGNSRLGEELAALVESRKWVAESRAHVDRLLKEIESGQRTARKGIEIAGVSPALGQVLRSQRRSLPTAESMAEVAGRRSALTGASGVRLFEVTEDSEALVDLAAALAGEMDEVGEEVAASTRGEIEREVREFLAARADLLGKLRDGYRGLLGDLVELEYEQRQLAIQSQNLREFLDQYLIWTPSAPVVGTSGSIVPQVGLAYFFEGPSWAAAGRTLLERAVARSGTTLAVLATALALLMFRRRVYQAIADSNARLNKLRQERYWNTPLAVLLCGLVVLPIPLLLAYAAYLLRTAPGADDFSRSLGIGLWFGIANLFLAHYLRVMCKPGSVAERHLRWPRDALARLRGHLRVLLYPVPFLAVVVTMAQEHPEPEVEQSIGRFLFIIAMALIAYFFARVLHPRSGVLAEYLAAHPGSWQTRLRWFWWLGLVLLPVAMIVGAALGYAYTAETLSELLILTMWMLAGVVVLHAVVIRWLTIAQRQLRFQQIMERREADRAAADQGDQAPVAPEEPEVDVAAIHAQARHLLNSVVGVSIAIGLILIWAPVVPAFGILDSVELWTARSVVEGKEVLEAVTLSDIALSLLVLVVVAALARDLPGFLEFAVLNRLPLAAGSRYAVATLAQYGVVTVAALFVFNRVGLRWSEVQWLVAALSVGLGFGLQEIVANFISGIILLFERPIRIGDTVTVGSLTGTVTRIQIRATTITDWDNKEIVVPNKTFITTDFINWTLSDSITRVVVPVGIAYGSDTIAAHRVMTEVATSSPLALEAPEPQVFFLGFGDSSLDFEVRVWVSDLSDLLPAKHQLHTELNRALEAAGISIPFPQRDLHLKSAEASLLVSSTGSRVSGSGAPEQQERPRGPRPLQSGSS